MRTEPESGARPPNLVRTPMPERVFTPARRHALTAAIGGVVLAGLVFGNAQAATAAPLQPTAAIPGGTASLSANEAAEQALDRAIDAKRDAREIKAKVAASSLPISDTHVDIDELADNARWLASPEVVPDVVLNEYTRRTLAETARVEARVADVEERFAVAEEARAAELAAAEAARVKAEQERIAAEAAAAAAAAAAEAERVAAEQAAAALAGGNTPEGAKATAAAMASSNYGWGADQFSCLVSLWERESGWNYQAYNASSGATGIPQSLPGNKMASAGADWETNATTQIAWGLGYIASVYGSPCGAWGHSESTGWY